MFDKISDDRNSWYVETDLIPGDVPSGLYWRVKGSFVAYLTSMADGTCAISDGADVDATGLFRFPAAAAANPGPDAWTLRFGGTVRFSGHFGALAITVDRPAVELTPAGGSLSAATGKPDDRRIQLATLRPAAPARIGETLLWPPLVPILTGEGSELFGGAYPPGLELDPLTIAVGAASVEAASMKAAG
ncbi:hypothetical protein GCM10023081_01120 [Arthrobacter ginkgonis]|uniref:Htaa domain-containing protein n=1 Tax=Arthrobacter ginkgonis TaxID=1630594 RepID=A0ABP7BPS2_9MICC